MRVHNLRKQVQEQRVYAVDFSTGDNITAMPRDIMVKIFSEMNPCDIPTLAVVCKTWKRNSTEPALWKHYCHCRWAGVIRWGVVDDVRCYCLRIDNMPAQVVTHRNTVIRT
jgi:hypothetical protein